MLALPAISTNREPRYPALRRVAWFFVLILSGIVYAPSLGGILIWDDHILVGGAGIGGGERFIDCFTQPFLAYYYRPMVSASFYLDHLLWRNTPFGYHQTNILLHVLTTAALMGMLQTLFRRTRIALLGGLLFAVQPVQVSTVAWIGGRTDSLCTLFIALFIWGLAGGARTTGTQRVLALSGAVLAYTAALFTKEQMLALLPLIPFAFSAFRPREDGDETAQEKPAATRRRMAVTLTASVVTSAGFVVLWLLLGPPRPANTAHSLLTVLAEGGHTLTYYTLLLLVPTPRWMHTLCLGTLEQAGFLSILTGYTVLGLLGWLFLRWRRTQPAAAWFLALILLTLLPVSNFLPLPSLLIAPYRAGVTGLGVAVLLGWALDQVFRALGDRRWALGVRTPVTLSPCHLVTLSLVLWHGGLTFWGAGQWQDEKTVFTTIVRYDPYSIIARLNLTTALLQKHQSRPAIVHLETLLGHLFGSKDWQQREAAVRAMAEDPRILERIRENQGNRIEPGQWLAAIYSQLGFAHMETDDYKKAKGAFLVGAAFYPRSSDVQLGLGDCAFQAGENVQAVAYLRRALVLDTNKTEARAKLGKALAALGRWQEARVEFAACLKEQPWAGQAYFELANAQRQIGDRRGAAATLEAALRIAPGREDLRRMLANL